MTKFIVKIDTETGKKTFSLDIGKLTAEEAATLLKFLDPPYQTLSSSSNGEYSFEERYWDGFIVLGDAPRLMKGWRQSELVEQYRSEPPKYPEFVKITKVER